MFRALKLLLGLGALAGFLWFGFTVELGDKTLFGHVRAIGDTQASHDLWDGTRQKFSAVGRDVTRVLGVGGPASKDEGPATKPAAPDARSAVRPPAEDLTEDDRQSMKRLLEDTRKESARPGGERHQERERQQRERKESARN